MNKLQLLIILGSSQILFSQTGNVGINTQTPKKTLHVNGSIQVTNELNIGGNATTAGSAGNSGQALISQGNGLPPIWQTLNLPSDDANSYKLKGVYRGTLGNASITDTQTSSPIGTINNIKVNSANNFIFIISQNITSTNSNSGSTTSSAINFEYKFNGTSYRSPVEILQRQGFADATKGVAYSFSILNVPAGTYALNTNAWKLSTNGTSETIYFNMDYNQNVKPGSIVVFVYEK